MSRSLWKGPFVDPKLMKLATESLLVSSKKPIKTASRSSTILPPFVGLKFSVHNGRNWNSFTVNEDMIGHKLGEFCKTRKSPKHKVKVSKVTGKK